MFSWPQSLKSNDGQLAIVMPLSLAMAVGGSLLWGYMQMMHTQAASNQNAMGANNAAQKVANRIQNLLAGPYPACTDRSTGNQIFSQFRNYAPTAPAIVPWTWPLAAGGPMAPIPCLLGDVNAGQDPSEIAGVQSLTIQVARVGVPDFIALTSQVVVSIQASSTTTNAAGQTSPAHTTTINHQYLIKAGKLADYSVVLLPKSISAGSTQIKLSRGAQVEFKGAVFNTYQTDLAAIAPLPSSGSVPNITFDQVLDSRPYQLQYSANGSLVPVDAGLLAKIFTKGVRTNVFGTVDSYGRNIQSSALGYPVIPMVDGNPNNTLTTDPGAWDASVFTQILDYSNVMTGTSTQYPVPDVQVPKLSNIASVGTDLNTAGVSRNVFPINGPFNFTSPAPIAPYKPAISCNDPLSPSGCFSAANAKAIESIPDANNVVYRLFNTCGSDMGHIPTFVYQRMGSFDGGTVTDSVVGNPAFSTNLTINFDSCNSSGCDPDFCGMVAVNTLNIVAPFPRTYAIYGTIVASQINITGPGKVVFANPADGQEIPGVPFNHPAVPLGTNCIPYYCSGYTPVTACQTNCAVAVPPALAFFPPSFCFQICQWYFPNYPLPGGGGTCGTCPPLAILPPVSYVGDTGQSVANLFSQIQTLATTTAGNFFVPFYRSQMLQDYPGRYKNPNYFRFFFPVSAGAYLSPCTGDPNNKAPGVVTPTDPGGINTYCMNSSMFQPATDGSDIAWADDTLAMSVIMTQ